jgi:hypothetical protein
VTDEIARLIELEHWRRRRAARLSGRGVRSKAGLGGEGHRVEPTVNEPDVILAVDSHTGDRTQNPMIGQWFRPEPIDFKNGRRAAGAPLRRHTREARAAEGERGEQRNKKDPRSSWSHAIVCASGISSGVSILPTT